MILDITSEEKSLLVQLLQRESEDLPAEVRRTETSSFRDELKQRERLVRSLVERLRRLEQAGAKPGSAASPA